MKKSKQIITVLMALVVFAASLLVENRMAMTAVSTQQEKVILNGQAQVKRGQQTLTVENLLELAPGDFIKNSGKTSPNRHAASSSRLHQ